MSAQKAGLVAHSDMSWKEPVRLARIHLLGCGHLQRSRQASPWSREG